MLIPWLMILEKGKNSGIEYKETRLADEERFPCCCKYFCGIIVELNKEKNCLIF